MPLSEETRKQMGAIYDFAAFLTVQEESVMMGAECDVAPMAALVGEFLKLRGLPPDAEPDFKWY